MHLKNVYKANETGWVFATNLNISVSLSLQPGGVNLWYFKLRLHNLTEFIVELSKVYDIWLQS